MPHRFVPLYFTYNVFKSLPIEDKAASSANPGRGCALIKRYMVATTCNDFPLLKDDLHAGTTLSLTTSLQQAYDMNCFL